VRQPQPPGAIKRAAVAREPPHDHDPLPQSGLRHVAQCAADIRDAGHEPEVVEYLKSGWTTDGLKGLLDAAGLTPREAMRTRGEVAAEAGLLEPRLSGAAILEAMIANPALVERPLVRTRKGVVLARPKDKVLEIL
jgi:arsenate reductase (glutaredoxin)